MKKTYLALLPFLLFSIAGCNSTPEVDPEPDPEPQPGPEPIDDGYVHTIREVRACEDAPSAKIKGRVILKGASSFLTYDGTGIILTFGNSLTSSVNVGDAVEITGDTGLRGTLAQFSQEAEVVQIDEAVPEFDYTTPTKLENLSGVQLTDVMYVSIDKTFSYHVTNKTYYQSLPIDDDDSYLSFGDSLPEYYSILEGTSEESPICTNMVGFLTGYEIASSFGEDLNRLNMLLSKELEQVELDLVSLTAQDTFPYYNLTTAFDDFKQLEVHGLYERGMDRLLSDKEYSYVVKDCHSEEIDSSKPFEASGEYTVYVSCLGIDADPITIKVNDDENKVAYATVPMLAESNGWNQSEASSFKDANLDENIAINLGGSGTGRYSIPNSTWSVTQKSSSDYPNGGYLTLSALNNYYLYYACITYYPLTTDAKPGTLENLDSGVLTGVGLKSNTYKVLSSDPAITDATVRLRSILVIYGLEEPQVDLVGVEAVNTRYMYEQYYSFAEVNGLKVNSVFSNGRKDAIGASEYTYTLADEAGENIDPTKPFEKDGKYYVYVTKGDYHAEPVEIIVVGVKKLTLSDAHGNYERITTFDATNELKVEASFNNDTIGYVPREHYDYVVKDSEGAEIDTSKFFPSAGNYTVKVTVLGIESNEITIKVTNTGIVSITKSVPELAELNGWAASGNTAGIIDGVISYKCGGGNTGNYSASNKSFSVFEANGAGYITFYVNDEFKDEFVIQSITLEYKKHSSDKEGHFEEAPNGVACVVNDTSITLKPKAIDEANNGKSVVRIRSITVVYAVKSSD